MENQDKLIADFMGKSCNKRKIINGRTIKKGESALKYHSSWDALITVTEKIESLGFEIVSFNKEASITGLETITSTGKDRFEAIYNAVLAFINWHSKNN